MNRTQAPRAEGRAAAAIRPVRPADLPALSGFFTGLSVESLYLRFFAPVNPAGSLLHLLSGGPANVDAMVAVVDGVIVGHAMAADQTQLADPCGAWVTDVGVVVADAWQRRGVGTALMRALITRAQARGAASLAMEVLPGNRKVIAMITKNWPDAAFSHSPDSLDIRIKLPRYQPWPPQARLASQPLATVGR